MDRIWVIAEATDGQPTAAVLELATGARALAGTVEAVTWGADANSVAAALVGTFLGILLSYGCFGPLASRLEFMGVVELGFFRAISSIVMGAAQSQSPKVVIEQARRGIGTEFRPTRTEMEERAAELTSQVGLLEKQLSQLGGAA